MNKLIVIHDDGRIEEQVRESISYHDVREVLRGLPELVPHFGCYHNMPCKVFVDEAAFQKGLTTNMKATLLWREQCVTTDHIIGPVVIVIGGKVNGNGR